MDYGKAFSLFSEAAAGRAGCSEIALREGTKLVESRTGRDSKALQLKFATVSDSLGVR